MSPPPPVAAASVGWTTAGEKGGATLVGLALAGFVLMAGLVAVDVGALAGARAAAQTAADLAALAALSPQTGAVAGSARSWGEARAPGSRPPTAPSWWPVSARGSRRWSVCGADCGSYLVA
jgi:hypothetical protein